MIVNQRATGASEILDFRRGLPQILSGWPNIADFNGGIGQRRAQIDSLVINGTTTAPEPSTVLLFGLSCIFLPLHRRR